MADLVITSSNVVPTDDTKTRNAICGETGGINAGELVYLDKTDESKAKLANNKGEAAATMAGIALNDGALNQPVTYARDGKVKVGTVLTSGEAYFCSANNGKLAPSADLVTGNYISLYALALDTETLLIINRNTKEQLP